MDIRLRPASLAHGQHCSARDVFVAQQLSCSTQVEKLHEKHDDVWLAILRTLSVLHAFMTTAMQCLTFDALQRRTTVSA
eukprot:526508-Lingulodinium_polyedra.AAC.1